jgi:4-carboxymuconolactone decarboxylase
MNPRIPPITPGTKPELAELEKRIMGSRGRVSPLYTILLNSPEVCSGWEQLMTAIRQKTSVPPALRELIILRVAVLNNASYEFEAHVPHALQAGVPQESIEKVKNSQIEGFSEVETLVLRYTDAITRDLEVSDGLFQQVQKHFPDAKTMLELSATVASYNMVSRFLIAMRIH